jgi:hypothetical protein
MEQSTISFPFVHGSVSRAVVAGDPAPGPLALIAAPGAGLRLLVLYILYSTDVAGELLFEDTTGTDLLRIHAQAGEDDAYDKGLRLATNVGLRVSQPVGAAGAANFNVFYVTVPA